ncbi:PRTRC system protein B [Undibacterium sp. Di27W]|uniref:PRTRC system protein B n=1 Tax=Undibacterium sp. Di27W TaxID=3413036 RepID=UPI003BF2BBF2
MKEGRLASQRSIRKFIKLVIGQKVKNELDFLPINILTQDDNNVIWWVPPGKQRVFFNSGADKMSNINAEIELPGLVFALIESNWYVFAVEGTFRPEPTSKVFFSPFFNVWDNHQICVGSTRVPKNRKKVDQWKAAFFSSAFTHNNYKSKNSQLTDGRTRAALWKSLIKTRPGDLTMEVLPPTGLSIATFIKEGSQHAP